MALFTAAVTVLGASEAVALAVAPASCIGGERDSRGRSSVDDGEVSWEDETHFDDARRHAMSAWSGRGLKRIRFPEDDATRVADLEWADVNRKDGQWRNVGGAWIGMPGTDTLALNRAYVGRGKRHGNKADRRQIAAHELGHALGFCHKDPGRGGATLMAPRLRDGAADGRPTARDRRDYQALWG
ncbi:matrixin family metalloprotease [Streptomyces sp. NPDC000594]|uniref:matrixin family metalloprotease n=1 Tax=Streptomyces sp. NPDC000594 TaxID=3154261 RepID=UPI00331C9AF7